MFDYSRNNTEESLLRLFDRYDKNGTPINVDFRKMVRCLKSSDRAAHLIHPYPAKLLMHIPFYFFANTILSEPGELILDPFAGSGTVLLESQLSGREAIGADMNPLARLVSEVKTTPLSGVFLRESKAYLLNKIPKAPKDSVPDVTNLKYWFYPHVIKQLLCILESIQELNNQDVKKFFLVCFSNCVRKTSLADPRISVPVKLRIDRYDNGHTLRNNVVRHLNKLRRINVTKLFCTIAESNINRINLLNEHVDKIPQAKMICSDARSLKYEFSNNGNKGNYLPKESVQLIITSPPYPGAQKYIRSSSLSLGWLDLCSTEEIPKYKDKTIGREEFRKSVYSQQIRTGINDADELLDKIFKKSMKRAAIAGAYLVEMRDVIYELYRVLRKGGYLVMIAANNKICGSDFKTQEYLRSIAREVGLNEILLLIDDIKSRGLMTKRNSTASVISCEWVMVFRKD